MLATTGFAIVRFGKVWDDARSILLLILLLFVEMSLVFDETLIRDPSTGRLLLLAGMAISIGLSELLLYGMRIRLPWLFRVPYHLLISLLFLYPLLLVSDGPRLPMDIVSWRILLFPVTAALILLTMLPAIRRGPEYTKSNGTPWLWPWYPWSLFVFLTVCVGFRAYALSLSFDPILGSSLTDALRFESTFGTYFLVPLVLACGVLLLEVGLVSQCRGAIRIAMQVPVVCLYLAVPAFVGSPLWLTLMAAAVFYFHAMLRRVASAHTMLAFTLIVATKVGPSTVDLATLTSTQTWPLLVIAVLQLVIGLLRAESRPVIVSTIFVAAVIYPMLNASLGLATASGTIALFMFVAILTIGALFRDEFAWLLRITAAPLIVLTTLAGIATACYIDHPLWFLPSFVLTLVTLSMAYAIAMRMRLYQLSAVISATVGLMGVATEINVVVVRDSGWKGANSFSIGLGLFLLALLISSWKAGWLNNVGPWLGDRLTFDDPYSIQP